MKPNDNIKNEIKNISFKASDELKQKMLEDVLNAQNKKQRSEQTPNVWRIIMSSKITKYVAAAIILIAAMIGINQFGDSINTASVALAQSTKALQEVLWVHITSGGKLNDRDCKSEVWHSSEFQIAAVRQINGTVIFKDYGENLKYQYNPETNEIIVSEMVRKFPHIPLEWNEFVQDYSNMSHEVDFLHWEEVVDENSVKVFKLSWLEEGGVRREREYTIDAESDLPLFAHIKSWHADGSNISETTQIFEYPPEGPVTIYEMDVPRTAKVYDFSSDEEENRKEHPSVRESANRLMALGNALLVYENDHDKYPDSLQGLEGYLDDLQWFFTNTEYLGKGRSKAPATATIAYDRTLLEKTSGRTNVLHNIGQVVFERPKKLK